MNRIIFIDTEVGIDDKKIRDTGAVKENGASLHTASLQDFSAFVSETEYLCGHNIVHHDMKYLDSVLNREYKLIDTLYLSPLLFPKKPYHALVKDDKLQTDALNNPLNDAVKAQELFYDEVSAFEHLPERMKMIFFDLLHELPEFKGFFSFVKMRAPLFGRNPVRNITAEFSGMICSHADMSMLIRLYPAELAYALALVHADDPFRIAPRWLTMTYPAVDYVMKVLRGTACTEGCEYCNEHLSVKSELKKFFGYSDFRTYNGEPLQQNAVQAAVNGKSLLAVFPTGGGKSLTFQLPALIAGNTVQGLTVVISPLQSLMKDQVDHLADRGVVNAAAINGMLNPVERAEVLERVRSGTVSILYISPEQLRSRTIERMLMSRHVVRFVIDEAHCFSSWGQDFRVDYLYIGDFIRSLQEKKGLKERIPVSCFTATAKQKVISDIRDYFKRKLDIEMSLYTTSSSRENLHYAVLFKENDSDKYSALRSLLEMKKCPSIVYVSRTKETARLAEKLNQDGYAARPYHGQMESKDKIENQEAFQRNEVQVIVATNAFGMGVDKSDVGLVVHYDISDSLENYVQEAGRAGRDPSLQADCYVLFNNDDLDRHFLLLNQTKLSIAEIQQVWKAVKELCGRRRSVSCSALEIARQAGWDEASKDVETRVRTALNALEQSGYIARGMNTPRIYATSIIPENMVEASKKIDASEVIPEDQKESAKRIIKSLISSRSIAKAGNAEAESRVDYLADILGIAKEDVINLINLMRQDSILADEQDMSAYIMKTGNRNKSMQMLEQYAELESFILERIKGDGVHVDYKEWNEDAQDKGMTFCNIRKLRAILYFMTIRNLIHKDEDAYTHSAKIVPDFSAEEMRRKYEHRIDLCRFIIKELFRRAEKENAKEESPVEFSLAGLLKSYNDEPRLDLDVYETTIRDVSDALLYLSKTGTMKLEGGFLVSYNGMQISRLIMDNRIKYKAADYHQLDEFYKMKIQQIHIVGEYANLMVHDYNAALQYVQDYFEMDYKKFISAYFKGDKASYLNKGITEEKYRELFGCLSDVQETIINDDKSMKIVVAAGPGSGKTRVLVHKLASLLMMEDVKSEQLLMLTFSRTAAAEFKQRLIDLVGSAAYYVEIKTFHSYCFDLLGQLGSLEASDNVVKKAVEMIRSKEAENTKIMKHVLVIDEAQDMDADEYELIKALMEANDDMRIIAVGDDDQNIYSFRGSDAKYFSSLITEYGAVKYEMQENYRSLQNIVSFSNSFIALAENRMKTIPCTAVQQESGIVQVIRHTFGHLEPAVVQQVYSHHHKGTACVLTQTNEEALQITALLNKAGCRAKLLQSLDGFRFSNLAEVRYFLKRIDDNLHGNAVIDNLTYKYAQDQLRRVYASSACLKQVFHMTEVFRQINKVMYRTDLQEFVNESGYEDFYDDHENGIYVSTMHKAKGREFDYVYLCLNKHRIASDEERRVIYVAMTRAKKELYIHTNGSLFESSSLSLAVVKTDHSDYPEADEITIQLGLRDVDLSFVKGKKREYLQLYSGQKLFDEQYILSADYKGKRIRAVKYSKAFREKMNQLMQKGYMFADAYIQFVVAWQGEDDPEESAVILPVVILKKLSAMN